MHGIKEGSDAQAVVVGDCGKGVFGGIDRQTIFFQHAQTLFFFPSHESDHFSQFRLFGKTVGGHAVVTHMHAFDEPQSIHELTHGRQTGQASGADVGGKHGGRHDGPTEWRRAVFPAEIGPDRVPVEPGMDEAGQDEEQSAHDMHEIPLASAESDHAPRRKMSHMGWGRDEQYDAADQEYDAGKEQDKGRGCS